MYDQILGKEEFVKRLKDLGFSDEEIANEWQRLIVIFNATFIQEYFELIPQVERQVILDGIDPNLSEIDREVQIYETILKRVKSDTNKGLLFDLQKKSAIITVGLYKDNFKSK